MTHRCDYCGSTFSLVSDDDMPSCESCGEKRLYNVEESRKSWHYQTVGHEYREPITPNFDSEEIIASKSKKKSKDIKAKKTHGPAYAESVKAKQGYRRS